MTSPQGKETRQAAVIVQIGASIDYDTKSELPLPLTFCSKSGRRRRLNLARVGLFAVLFCAAYLLIHRLGFVCPVVGARSELCKIVRSDTRQRWLGLIPFPSGPLLPSQDPFYDTPANLSLYLPGSLLGWRQVHSTLPALQFAQAKRMVQLAYATTDAQGGQSHSVATLYEPLSIVSYGALHRARILVVTVWEDAVSLDCNPSWSLRVGGANGQSVLLDTSVVINWGLERGYFVLVPDHEGPNSAFAVGWQEGAMTLDAIRTALEWASFDPNRTSVALWGYSGGGHAAAWAAQRHASYAPDVHLVAAAMGGVPVDLETLVHHIDGGAVAGFVSAGLAGLGAGYPMLEQWIKAYALPSLRATISWLRSGVCLLPELSVLAGRKFIAEFGLPDPLSHPVPSWVLQRESLLSPTGGGSLVPPSFPRYIWHALHDEVVPFGPVADWVATQCTLSSSASNEKGGNVAFVIHPVGGHASAQGAGMPSSLAFIAQALDGQLQSNWTCGTNPCDKFSEQGSEKYEVGTFPGGICQHWLKLNGSLTPWGPIQVASRASQASSFSSLQTFE